MPPPLTSTLVALQSTPGPWTLTSRARCIRGWRRRGPVILDQELKFIITTSAIFFVHKVASLRDSSRCLSLPSTHVLGCRDAAASRLANPPTGLRAKFLTRTFLSLLRSFVALYVYPRLRPWATVLTPLRGV